MTGFECKIDGASGTASIGKPLPPKYCPSGSGCVSGPKQPMYWANDRSNIQYSGEYFQKPSYNAKWGFKNGAQDDIFDGASGSNPSPADSASPTTLVTVTSKPAATPTPPPSSSGSPGSSGSSGSSSPGRGRGRGRGSDSCSWAGHCAGASCGSDDECSDDLTCQSGKCA